jgi:hypothetical protein
MKISLSLEYAESGTLAERLHAVAEAGIPAVNLGTSQIRHLLATAPSETELLNEQITGYGLAVDWCTPPSGWRYSTTRAPSCTISPWGS